MPSPTNPADSDQRKREQLASRLADLSPAQREQLRKRIAAQRADPDATSKSVDRADTDHNAIAIIGMGCRLPGAANPTEFWNLIANGTEAVRPVPSDRWDQSQFYDPTGRTPGKMSVDALGSLDQVDGFDPGFFGIAPREASRMDPQQRLLLEVAWETFEDAGISADSMKGTNTGVFIGIGGTDYSKVPARHPNYFEQVDAHMGTGNALSIAAGRISYVFDLQGPSFIVDTACSSGLVAIHSAAVSLMRGESDAAIAGAVNLILSPETTIAFSKARMLSPDGHCRPFDGQANGYVRGEGCSLVLLKRMVDARRDGDRIIGILRGSAVNQDGRTSGITAPSGSAQQRVIRSAMKAANVSENDLTYIEAHGTGTPLGDPIELMALNETFRSRSADLPPIQIGSVKANIGHTETVSGVAGLLKVLMMFGEEKIPAQVNFAELNPNARLKSSTLKIASESKAWHANPDGRFIAGVSSFGFGGTNAHLIVEKPIVDKTAPDPKTVVPPTFCLPFSARSDDALDAVATQLINAVSDADAAKTHNVCGTLANHRTPHPIRRVALGDSSSSLCKAIGKTKITDRRPVGRRTRIAMLFTGQGSQYINMGQRLAQTLPAFQTALDACALVLNPVLPASLAEILAGAEIESPSGVRTVNHTSLAQPAICAIQCALVDTYRSIGIRPDVVAGHSIGEVAALYAAGALSREQALLIAAYRGQVMGELPSGGAMTALLTDADTVAELINRTGSSAVIATMNGPGSTVVAGTAKAVSELANAATADEIQCQTLVVSHAFHSPLMQAAAEPLREKLSTLLDKIEVPRNVTFLSALTGESCSTIDVDYWVNHLLNSVRFTDVMQQLGKQKLDLAIEVGPRPQLCSMLRRMSTMDESFEGIQTISSLDANRDDYENWLRSVASAWCVGANVNWRLVHEAYPSVRVDLPTYPFQRQRYWYDPPAIGRSGGSGAAVHPLLGTAQSLASGDTIYSTVFRDNDPNYFADHIVSGSITVPAAAWIEALRAAAQLALPAGSVELQNVQISRALFLKPQQGVAIQTHVSAVVGGRCKIQISFRPDQPDAEWQNCAAATASKPVKLPQSSITESNGPSVQLSGLYAAMSESGLQYGEFFQTLKSAASDGRTAMAELLLADDLRIDSQTCRLHPALLDGALQLIATVVPSTDSRATFLPVGVDKVTCGDGQAIARARVQRRSPADGETDFEMVVADVELFDCVDELVAVLSGVQLKRLQRSQATGQADPSTWIHQVDWSPATKAETSEQFKIAVTHVGAQRTESLIPPPIDDADATHWVWTAPASGLNSESASGLNSESVVTATSSLLSTIQDAIRVTPAPTLSIITENAIDLHPSAALTNDAVNPVSSSLVALARVAANEHPQLNIQLLDVDEIGEPNAESIISWLNRDQDESELALRGGRFFKPRLVSQPRLLTSNLPTAEVGLPAAGSYRLRLDGTNRTEGLWVERIHQPTVNRGEVAVNVRAVGLNFSDVLKSMGLYPGIKDKVVPLGIEVCGRVIKVGSGANSPPIGSRVMGVVPHGFASDDATNDYLLTEVPANLSDEEAAALPIAFLTAQHALIHVGRLSAGESVLIHAGAGGVGLAAIQVAKAVGATIFTTAGHPTKRRLLAAQGIEAQNIFDSRDVRSIEAIRERTGGRGVDVVLNSLPGEWIDASINLLAAHGRFLEIGKIDIYQNRPVGLLPFQDNLSYSAIDLDRLLRERPQQVRELYAEICAAFATGVYQPLPITSFRLEELPSSMRFMAARRNIGKIVVSPPPAKPDPATVAGVHLITGGSGSIALGAARRLVTRGATAIALVARSAPKDDVTEFIQWAEQQGAKCIYLQSDCTDAPSLQRAVDSIPDDLGPIVGVIHAAGLLDDGLIHSMSTESLAKVLKPKVAGTLALDQVTAGSPLRYFTMLGSLASIIGSPGQANYAAANAFMEGFAADRRRRNLPASVVHWGPWSGNPHASSGMANEAAIAKNLAARGLRGLQFERAIDLLVDSAFMTDAANPVIVDADWNRMLSGVPDLLPSMLRSLRGASDDASTATGSAKDEALLAQLENLEPADRTESLKSYFADQIGHIMSMDSTTIDPAQPLGSLGLDSLMAIELKNTIETRLDIVIPISKFMDDPTLESLASAATELLAADVAISQSSAVNLAPAADIP